MRGVGSGFSLVVSLCGGPQPSSEPIIPGDPNLPRVPPLVMVAYGVWIPVLQAPAQGRLTIVGGLLPPLPRGRIPPSPRGRNSYPYLLMIHISLILCALPRGDGMGSAAASTLSPSPPLSSPPELSVWFVDI